MRKVLLITVILSSLLLSCGIFTPGGIFDPEGVNQVNDENINRVYDIVEIHNKPIQDWVEEFTTLGNPLYDWPEKIELWNYSNGQKIEGRVKMHNLGWFPIIDRELDSGNSFSIDIDKEEFLPVTGLGFYDNSIGNNNLEGVLAFTGPLIDSALFPYRATR